MSNWSNWSARRVLNPGHLSIRIRSLDDIPPPKDLVTPGRYFQARRNAKSAMDRALADISALAMIGCTKRR